MNVLSQVLSIVVAILSIVSSGWCQDEPRAIGIFEDHYDIDVDDPPSPGEMTYNEQEGSYTIVGGGRESFPSDRHGGHFAFKEMNGDFRIELFMRHSRGSGSDDGFSLFSIYDKTITTTTDESVPWIGFWATPTDVGWSCRSKANGGQYNAPYGTWVPHHRHSNVFEIQREGNTFTLFYYDTGGDLVTFGQRTLEISDPVYFVIACTSQEVDGYSTGYFSDIQIEPSQVPSAVTSWDVYK